MNKEEDKDAPLTLLEDSEKVNKIRELNIIETQEPENKGKSCSCQCLLF